MSNLYLDVRVGNSFNISISSVSAVVVRNTYKKILVAGNEQVERIITEGDTQHARVLAEGDTQYDRVLDEGDTQHARVLDEGNTQVARVIDEGDTQVARVLQAGDEGYIDSRQAEASALTSDEYATAPIDDNVKIYYYDVVTDTILFNTSSDFSAFHWQEKAKFLASGLTYIGTWDASTGVYPPDGTATGEFYIVSVSGIINTEQFNVGDWLIWSDIADGGTDTYNAVHWLFSWAIAQDVTVDGVAPAIGDDLARRATSVKIAGDIMDGNLGMENLIALQGITADGLTARDMAKLNANGEIELGDALATTRALGNWAFDGNPPVINNAPTAVNHATRKDYVDKGAIPINGVIMYDGLVSAIPANFQLMALNNVVMVATTTEAEFGTVGGSNDAVAISHTHTFTGDAMAEHAHNASIDSSASDNGGSRVGSDGGGFWIKPGAGATGITATAPAGTPAGTISTDGVAGTNLNMQAYVKMGYIKRIS